MAAEANEFMLRRLRLFALNAVLFPGTVLNLHVFESRYKRLIGECLESGECFGVALIRQGSETGDFAVEPHDVGTTAQIREAKPLPFGRYYVSTIGRERFRIRRILSREPYLTVEADILPENDAAGEELARLRERVRGIFCEYRDAIVEFSGEKPEIDLPQDPSRLSFIVADALQIADAVKQQLLAAASTRRRLMLEHDLLQQLLPQVRKLLERRAELGAAGDRRNEQNRRSRQERYFGKYFSAN